MKLRDYIKNRKLSVRAAARDGGFPEENFRLWSLGRSVPRSDVMLRLYNWSNGHVTPNDFYDLPAATRDAAGERAAECRDKAAVSPVAGAGMNKAGPGHAFDHSFAGAAG